MEFHLPSPPNATELKADFFKPIKKRLDKCIRRCLRRQKLVYITSITDQALFPWVFERKSPEMKDKDIFKLNDIVETACALCPGAIGKITRIIDASHLAVVEITSSTDEKLIGRKFLSPWGLVRKLAVEFKERVDNANECVGVIKTGINSNNAELSSVPSVAINSTPEVMSHESGYEDREIDFQTSASMLNKDDYFVNTSNSEIGVSSCVEMDGPKFKVNDWVSVERRMWRGINKPGGIARVTAIIEKVVSNSDSGGPVEIEYMYNVKYPVENGREKGVEEVFMSPWSPGDHVDVDDTRCGDASAHVQAGRDIKGRCRRKDCNSFIRDCKHLQPSDELLSKLNQIAEKKDMDDAALELNADQPVDDAGNGSNVSESSKASKTRFHHRDCLHGATSDSKATANRRRKSKSAAPVRHRSSKKKFVLDDFYVQTDPTLFASESESERFGSFSKSNRTASNLAPMDVIARLLKILNPSEEPAEHILSVPVGPKVTSSMPLSAPLYASVNRVAPSAEASVGSSHLSKKRKVIRIMEDSYEDVNDFPIVDPASVAVSTIASRNSEYPDTDVDEDSQELFDAQMVVDTEDETVPATAVFRASPVDCPSSQPSHIAPHAPSSANIPPSMADSYENPELGDEEGDFIVEEGADLSEPRAGLVHKYSFIHNIQNLGEVVSRMRGISAILEECLTDSCADFRSLCVAYGDRIREYRKQIQLSRPTGIGNSRPGSASWENLSREIVVFLGEMNALDEKYSKFRLLVEENALNVYDELYKRFKVLYKRDLKCESSKRAGLRLKQQGNALDSELFSQRTNWRNEDLTLVKAIDKLFDKYESVIAPTMRSWEVALAETDTKGALHGMDTGATDSEGKKNKSVDKRGGSSRKIYQQRIDVLDDPDLFDSGESGNENVGDHDDLDDGFISDNDDEWGDNFGGNSPRLQRSRKNGSMRNGLSANCRSKLGARIGASAARSSHRSKTARSKNVSVHRIRDERVFMAPAVKALCSGFAGTGEKTVVGKSSWTEVVHKISRNMGGKGGVAENLRVDEHCTEGVAGSLHVSSPGVNSGVNAVKSSEEDSSSEEEEDLVVGPSEAFAIMIFTYPTFSSARYISAYPIAMMLEEGPNDACGNALDLQEMALRNAYELSDPTTRNITIFERLFSGDCADELGSFCTTALNETYDTTFRCLLNGWGMLCILYKDSCDASSAIYSCNSAMGVLVSHMPRYINDISRLFPSRSSIGSRCLSGLSSIFSALVDSMWSLSLWADANAKNPAGGSKSVDKSMLFWNIISSSVGASASHIPTIMGTACDSALLHSETIESILWQFKLSVLSVDIILKYCQLCIKWWWKYYEASSLAKADTGGDDIARNIVSYLVESIWDPMCLVLLLQQTRRGSRDALSTTIDFGQIFGDFIMRHLDQFAAGDTSMCAEDSGIDVSFLGISSQFFNLWCLLSEFFGDKRVWTWCKSTCSILSKLLDCYANAPASGANKVDGLDPKLNANNPSWLLLDSFIRRHCNTNEFIVSSVAATETQKPVVAGTKVGFSLGCGRFLHALKDNDVGGFCSSSRSVPEKQIVAEVGSGEMLQLCSQYWMIVFMHTHALYSIRMRLIKFQERGQNAVGIPRPVSSLSCPVVPSNFNMIYFLCCKELNRVVHTFDTQYHILDRKEAYFRKKISSLQAIRSNSMDKEGKSDTSDPIRPQSTGAVSILECNADNLLQMKIDAQTHVQHEIIRILYSTTTAIIKMIKFQTQTQQETVGALHSMWEYKIPDVLQLVFNIATFVLALCLKCSPILASDVNFDSCKSTKLCDRFYNGINSVFGNIQNKYDDKFVGDSMKILRKSLINLLCIPIARIDSGSAKTGGSSGLVSVIPSMCLDRGKNYECIKQFVCSGRVDGALSTGIADDFRGNATLSAKAAKKRMDAEVNRIAEDSMKFSHMTQRLSSATRMFSGSRILTALLNMFQIVLETVVDQLKQQYNDDGVGGKQKYQSSSQYKLMKKYFRSDGEQSGLMGVTNQISCKYGVFSCNGSTNRQKAKGSGHDELSFGNSAVFMMYFYVIHCCSLSEMVCEDPGLFHQVIVYDTTSGDSTTQVGHKLVSKLTSHFEMECNYVSSFTLLKDPESLRTQAEFLMNASSSGYAANKLVRNAAASGNIIAMLKYLLQIVMIVELLSPIRYSCDASSIGLSKSVMSVSMDPFLFQLQSLLNGLKSSQQVIKDRFQKPGSSSGEHGHNPQVMGIGIRDDHILAFISAHMSIILRAWESVHVWNSSDSNTLVPYNESTLLNAAQLYHHVLPCVRIGMDFQCSSKLFEKRDIISNFSSYMLVTILNACSEYFLEYRLYHISIMCGLGEEGNVLFAATAIRTYLLKVLYHSDMSWIMASTRKLFRDILVRMEPNALLTMEHAPELSFTSAEADDCSINYAYLKRIACLVNCLGSYCNTLCIAVPVVASCVSEDSKFDENFKTCLGGNCSMLYYAADCMMQQTNQIMMCLTGGTVSSDVPRIGNGMSLPYGAYLKKLNEWCSWTTDRGGVSGPGSARNVASVLGCARGWFLCLFWQPILGCCIRVDKLLNSLEPFNLLITNSVYNSNSRASQGDIAQQMANNWTILLLLSQYSSMYRVLYSCILTTTFTGGSGSAAERSTVLRQVAREIFLMKYQQLLWEFGSDVSQVVIKCMMGEVKDPSDMAKQTSHPSLLPVLQELALGVQLHKFMDKSTGCSTLWKYVSFWLHRLCNHYTVTKAKLRDFLLSISSTLIRSIRYLVHAASNKSYSTRKPMLVYINRLRSTLLQYLSPVVPKGNIDYLRDNAGGGVSDLVTELLQLNKYLELQSYLKNQPGSYNAMTGSMSDNLGALLPVFPYFIKGLAYTPYVGQLDELLPWFHTILKAWECTVEKVKLDVVNAWAVALYGDARKRDMHAPDSKSMDIVQKADGSLCRKLDQYFSNAPIQYQENLEFGCQEELVVRSLRMYLLTQDHVWMKMDGNGNGMSSVRSILCVKCLLLSSTLTKSESIPVIEEFLFCSMVSALILMVQCHRMLVHRVGSKRQQWVDVFGARVDSVDSLDYFLGLVASVNIILTSHLSATSGDAENQSSLDGIVVTFKQLLKSVSCHLIGKGDGIFSYDQLNSNFMGYVSNSVNLWIASARNHFLCSKPQFNALNAGACCGCVVCRTRMQSEALHFHSDMLESITDDVQPTDSTSRNSLLHEIACN